MKKKSTFGDTLSYMQPDTASLQYSSLKARQAQNDHYEWRGEKLGTKGEPCPLIMHH